MRDYSNVGITKSLKAMFVLATREGLKSRNLVNNDPVIAKVKNNVSVEYPIESVRYPSIWVTTSFDKLAWQSLNSTLFLPDGSPYNRGEFSAKINLEAMALSNEERDAIVDALVNMIMFGHMTDDSNLFFKFLAEEPYIDVTPMTGEMFIGQESVTFGTPWDERQIAYTRSMSFNVYGEFAQRLDNNELIMLRDIELYPEDSSTGLPL